MTTTDEFRTAAIEPDAERHEAHGEPQVLPVDGTGGSDEPREDILPPLPTEAEKPDAAIIGRRFDYTVVADDIAEQMRLSADCVQQMTRAAVVEVGRELLTIKSRIEHGHFTGWVERACGLSIRFAQRAMAAAEMVGKNDNLSYLPIDDLLALAARSAPEPVVAEIIGRIDAGEHPTTPEIKATLATARRAEEEARLRARQQSARRRRKAEQASEQETQRRLAERQAAREAAARSAATMLAAALGQRLGEFVALFDMADPYAMIGALRSQVCEMMPVSAEDAAEAGDGDHEPDGIFRLPLPFVPPTDISAAMSSAAL